MSRQVKSVVGVLLMFLGAGAGILAYFKGGLTLYPLVLALSLMGLGGHLVSHSLMREVVRNINAVRKQVTPPDEKDAG